jgi:hypothetical protein
MYDGMREFKLADDEWDSLENNIDVEMEIDGLTYNTTFKEAYRAGYAFVKKYVDERDEYLDEDLEETFIGTETNMTKIFEAFLSETNRIEKIRPIGGIGARLPKYEPPRGDTKINKIKFGASSFDDVLVNAFIDGGLSKEEAELKVFGGKR